MKYAAAARNTLSSPWWRVRLAKLLGKKIIGRETDCIVIAYRWRGVVYMTDIKYGE